MCSEKWHSWDVTPQEARKIQESLRERWVGTDICGEIRTVAGLDTAFVLRGSQALGNRGRWRKLREANRAIGGVVVYQFPEMIEVERAFASEVLRFPYVPGLLSFREIPVLLASLKKLKKMPDLLFCDGQGIAHPRRMGLATHLGVVLDRPTIGCAKSILVGTHGKLGKAAGSRSVLVDKKEGGETIGVALRTRTGARPVYVSQGNKVSLETAVRMTLAVSDGFRIPRPTRDADHFVAELKLRNGAAASEK
ncbi:MAG: deoxyribonuclease V [Candidatus Acidiferrum sp.]